jgi:osmotically-inducible protein OsmY
MSRSALGVDPDDPRLYDLVLNTERLSIESCAEQIARLVATPEFRESEATRGALRDRFLEARVRAALHERFSMASGVADLEVEAREGRVSLAGKALHPELSKDIAGIVRAIEGVSEVENRITIVRPSGLIVTRKPRKRTHAPSET